MRFGDVYRASHRLDGVDYWLTSLAIPTVSVITDGCLEPGWMAGEGTGDGVEAVALPAPSPRGRAQRIGEMGIIGRDGR